MSIVQKKVSRAEERAKRLKSKQEELDFEQELLKREIERRKQEVEASLFQTILYIGIVLMRAMMRTYGFLRKSFIGRDSKLMGHFWPI